MDAKQYLRQLRLLDDLINAKFEQIQRLRSLAERVTGVLSPDKVQSSFDQDKAATIIARVVDLENNIKTSVDELIDLKAEVISLIDKVPNDDCRLVLTLRYVNFYTWEQIAVTLPCAYRTALYIHGRALREFEKVLREYKKIA